MRTRSLLIILPMLAAVACWHSAPMPLAAPSDSGVSDEGAPGGSGADAIGDGGAAGRGGSSGSAVADASDGAGADASPPPRPAGCDAPGVPVDGRVFSDGFESYSIGPFADVAGSPWIEAAMGRDLEISSAFAGSGANSLLIQSFFPKPETVYAPVTLDPLPPRITFQTTFLLDGFIEYEDFPAWGLATVPSRYDVRPVLQLKMSGHQLLLVESGGATSVLYSELDYGDPPRANTVRVDLDLCAWQAAVSVGVPASPLALRATVGVEPFASAAVLFVTGGVNQAYVDDVSVDVLSP